MIRFCLVSHADVVKLADTIDSKSIGLKTLVGSTPTIGTPRQSLGDCFVFKSILAGLHPKINHRHATG